jgi:ribosomal protein S19
MKSFKRKFPSPFFFRKRFKPSAVFSRSSKIPKKLVGQKLLVYNGNSFRSLTPKVESVGYPVGYFSFTKITGFSIHKRKRKKKEKKKRGRKLNLNFKNGNK